MTYTGPGLVVALRFDARPDLEFADIVEEFDIAFRFGTDHRALIWQGDDTAFLDRENLRLALRWVTPLLAKDPWHLVLGLGSAPGHENPFGSCEVCEAFLQHILEHLTNYLPPDQLLQTPIDSALDATLLTEMAENLRLGEDALRTRARPKSSEEAEAAEQAEPAPKPRPAPEKEPHSPEMHALREALNEAVQDADRLADQPGVSLPMHMTIYVLGATMLLHVPPVGGALLTYSLLRDTVGDRSKPKAA